MDIFFLGGRRARKDVVGVACRGRVLDVTNDDELAFGIVTQDLHRAVVVACLSHQRVARVLPQHLDGGAELDIRRLAVLVDGNLVGTYSGAGFSHTPELKVSICSPWSMASSQENTGMILLDLVLVISVLKGKVNWKAWAPSRAPVPPPGMPMLPVTAASRKIARALFSPLA